MNTDKREWVRRNDAPPAPFEAIMATSLGWIATCIEGIDSSGSLRFLESLQREECTINIQPGHPL